MKKKIIFLFFLCFSFTITVLAEDDGPAEIGRVEYYDKTPIEDLVYDKEKMRLVGASAPGSFVTIDTGDSAVVTDDGTFEFTIPKESKMIIVNAVNPDGMFPNSVIFGLDANRPLEEGEATPPPKYDEEKKKEDSKEKTGKEKKENSRTKVTESSLRSAKNKKKVKGTTVLSSSPKNRLLAKEKQSDQGVFEDYYWLCFVLLGLILILIVLFIICLKKEKKKSKKERRKKSGRSKNKRGTSHKKSIIRKNKYKTH